MVSAAWKILCNHSYQSSDLNSKVDEYSKILHQHCIRIGKEKMDKVNFGFLSWLFCIDCVVH